MNIKHIIKQSLLSIPYIRRYVDQVQSLRLEVTSKEEQIERLKNLITHSRSPALFNSLDDFSTERLLSHPAIHPLPNTRIGSEEALDNPNRIKVAERLLNAYHQSLGDEKKSNLNRNGEDLWTGILRDELPDLMEAIDKGNAKKLADYLRDFGKSFVWFGGVTTCIDGYNRNLDPKQVSLTYLDKLVCLGESLGILRFENPENGPWGNNLQVNVDQLINDIEQVLNISISPPLNIIHTDGLTTDKGLFHYRHIHGLYSAIRIAKLTNCQGRVCELGGGIGITAMYSRRLGILDYTLLDLPITCLLAGHYLLHSIGLDDVVLYGESNSSGSIKILPYWECVNLKHKNYKLTINQDSLPEIDDNLIQEYLVQIRRITTDFFLSINHECFHPKTVNNFIQKETGYKQLYRHKCWIREGYLEELYRIQAM
ncbi:hypothetical protein Lepto7376_2195 [[Leptolyngbya] sp. PCC 7376]|uniref:putative sugar O-methyltransferase n=1 Tax=[Leptolyngbya] sp. PCC 7376 TaxID=111781 RepID=UPI00029F24A8|nr:putative sugar O-methyltransferase [[Leptolyngbya] sp. PCC 7376]AFY38486.1 hypothetical protein Lepto7376_2195 [[Leptolyngbya] sp. PCC 7376]